MTYSDFKRLLWDARESSSAEYFLGSLGWQPWMDAYGEDHADDIVNAAYLIFSLARAETTRDIRDIRGLTQAEFAFEYGISLRTVQTRESRKAEASGATFDMLRFAVWSDMAVTDE